MRGRVFDIRKYSIHDGPGIRTTVFLKGCSLNCRWCHNPEGIEGNFELMHWPSRCVRCYSCLSACPPRAIGKDDSGAIGVERTKCDLCGKCAEACPSEAMQIVGRAMTVEDVVREVEKDRIFYEQSGGGVTFSGGDPLSQPGFLESLLDAFRTRKIHTAVDTSGSAPHEVMDRIAARTDLILYDLKIMDDDSHRKFTGVTNALILDNLRRIAAGKTEVWVRVPLVAGINDDEENIRLTIEFLKSLKTIRSVSFLPYHPGGTEKAKRLGKRAFARAFAPPSDERLETIRREFDGMGFQTITGG